jgi:hypothetical protein
LLFFPSTLAKCRERLPGQFVGIVTTHYRSDKAVIIGMVPDPVPNKAILPHHRKRPIVQTDTS